MPSILITGVSSGLGHALAQRAYAAGWDVFGTVRDEKSAEDHELPSGVSLTRLELRFPQAVAAFSERFVRDHGAPDVLVNNAGFAVFAPVEETSAEELRELFQVNTFAAVELATAFLPAMRKRGSGTIVNVTSVGGRLVFPYFAAYNSSKHALEALSEGLWHELRPFGIRVKIIEAGYIQTPIFRVLERSARASGPYAGGLKAMRSLAEGVQKHASPEDAADEVWRAIMDTSDRLRYPAAAYARRLLLARKLLSDRRFLKRMHAAVQKRAPHAD